jgi:hypothetical protein
MSDHPTGLKDCFSKCIAAAILKKGDDKFADRCWFKRPTQSAELNVFTRQILDEIQTNVDPAINAETETSSTAFLKTGCISAFE